MPESSWSWGFICSCFMGIWSSMVKLIGWYTYTDPEKGVTNFGMRDAVQDATCLENVKTDLCNLIGFEGIAPRLGHSGLPPQTPSSELLHYFAWVGSVFCEQMLPVANCGVQYLQPSFQELSVIKMYLEFLQSWSIYPTQCCIIETYPI